MSMTGGRIVSADSVDDSPLILMQAGETTITAIRVINTTAAAAFVQLFDAAAITDVTLGTTAPTWAVESSADGVGLGDGVPEDGLVFKNGVVVGSTTTSTGSTAAVQHVRLVIG